MLYVHCMLELGKQDPPMMSTTLVISSGGTSLYIEQ